MAETPKTGISLKALHEKFINNSQTVAVAESCTGGGLGYQLSRLPGASAYFLGGVISYCNAIKTGHLSVPAQDIQSFGAVSEQVARAMALGCLAKFTSDWSIAITGIAGPGGGSSEKPVGTVWIAHASQEKKVVSCVKYSFGEASRDEIRNRAIETAVKTMNTLL